MLIFPFKVVFCRDTCIRHGFEKLIPQLVTRLSIKLPFYDIIRPYKKCTSSYKEDEKHILRKSYSHLSIYSIICYFHPTVAALYYSVKDTRMI